MIPNEMRSISATFDDLELLIFMLLMVNLSDLINIFINLNGLKKHENILKNSLSSHQKLVVVGDFNIVPNENDASNFSPEDILCSDKERMHLQDILDLGLTDCYKPQDNVSPYTWWDYSAGAFHRDVGYRIDLLLASARSFKKDLKHYEVHRETRHKSWCPEQPKTSDHAPVMITF